MSNKIAIEHPAYKAMSEEWPLIDALCGGTSAMRSSGRKWLPQEPRETNPAYNVRKNRSFLFPGLKETIKMLSGKPFQQDIIVVTETDAFKELAQNVDSTGRNVTQFSRDVMKDAMKYGLSHIVVDFPKQAEDAPKDKASQAASGITPYFVHVKAKDLINWTTEIIDGQVVLTSITMRTRSYKNVGNGQVPVSQIRVMTWTEIIVYEEKSKNKTEEIERFNHTFGSIPLQTVYANREAHMVATPPLRELAYTNLAHWQSASDQRNILRIARVPFLFASGFSNVQGVDGDGKITASELDAIGEIGPNSLITSSQKDANVKWVEHEGSGITSGKEDLDTLKEEMFVQGAQFLVPKKSNMTATEFSGNQSTTQSELQAVVGSLQDALNTCFGYAAEWLEIENTAVVNVYRDFNRDLTQASDTDLLFKSREKGLITQETFLNEMKRRDVLADGLDVEEEIKNLENEDDVLSAILPKNNGGE